MRTSLAAVLVLVACGPPPLPGARDLAATSRPDLASASDLAETPDLAEMPDLVRPDLAVGSFCAGTAVAGTCAQAYFAKVASCFRPAGTCTKVTGMNLGSVCWQSGAKFAFVADEMTRTARGTWTQSGKPCMTADVAMGMVGATITFATSDGKLVMDENGAVTCPGGKANLGMNFGGCQALDDLIRVPGLKSCPDGACP